MLFFGLLLIGPAEPGTGKPMVNLTIGYLPTILGEHRDKQGLSISGAITYALQQIEEKKILPDGVSLVLQFNDTRSDLLLTTKALTEMMCKDVVAVFGPENTCNVEATISSAWNRMMISHVSFIFSDSFHQLQFFNLYFDFFLLYYCAEMCRSHRLGQEEIPDVHQDVPDRDTGRLLILKSMRLSHQLLHSTFLIQRRGACSSLVWLLLLLLYRRRLLHFIRLGSFIVLQLFWTG